MSRSAVPALLLVACVEEADSSGLLLPEQVQVGWEAEYNARGDGLGALVPVDVMVYDGATGEPRADVEVHVWTDDDAAMPVPVEGVLVLDRDLELGPNRELEAWDAEHDQFVALEPVELLDLRTDAGGVARLYLFVDAFPEGAGPSEPFGPIRVMVSTGDVDELFWLEPR
jgi:hypothetical protein